MTLNHPDLLQRFIPTPFIRTLGETYIESNSEALTSAIQTELHPITHLKIIIDHTVTADATALTHIQSAHISTLLRGTATILIFDRDTRELLAFLALGVSFTELLNTLIPAVLRTPQVAELQTHDIGTIAP